MKKNNLKIILYVSIFLFLFVGCKKNNSEEILTPTLQPKRILNIFVENIDEKDSIQQISNRFGLLNNVEVNIFSELNENIHIGNFDLKNNTYKNLLEENKLYDLKNSVGKNNLQTNINEKFNNNYVVPLAGNVYGLIVNRELFNKNTIVAPKNWGELLNIKNKITSNYIYGFQVFESPFSNAFIFPNLFLTLNKNNDLESVSKSMIDIFGLADKNSIKFNYNQGITEFASGRALMFLGSNKDIEKIKYIKPEIKLGIINLPYENSTSIILEVETGFSILENSENKDLSLEFLEYLTIIENVEFYSESIKKMPLIKESQSPLVEFTNINKEIKNSNIEFLIEFSEEEKQQIKNNINSILEENQYNYFRFQ